jgi:16S rRNA (cytidine(1402)-2'-O)-methyltransferase
MRVQQRILLPASTSSPLPSAISATLPCARSKCLRGVDRIACEDTRQTQKLLNHFQIEKKTVSCHEHNEHTRAKELIQDIKAGTATAIALVSDAGTPGVSDPGSWLVREAIAAGVPVFPIPGANAAVSALITFGTCRPTSFNSSVFCRRRPARGELEKLAAQRMRRART